MGTTRKTRQFLGLATIEKIYVAIVLLLIFLVVCGFPPYSIKSKTVGNMKYSSDGDRIPLRAIERIAQKRFVAWAKNPIVVEAVREANKKPAKSLHEIIQLDKKWVAGQSDENWVNQFLDNPCARYLRHLQNEQGSEKNLYAEIFVTDKQGCIVAESEMTSDFWQGDEDKFVKAFADGKGAIFVDESGYDRSTQTHLIQVSLPVLEPSTRKAIGVMTIGLNIGILDEQL
jgi:hypothetical protein